MLRRPAAISGRAVALLALVGLLCAAPVFAGTLFTADLDGGQETPPNGSAATGHADCYLNSGATSLRIELTIFNFTNTMTACHVHVGAVGVAGAVAHNIGVFSGSTQLDWALTPTDVANLQAGLLYINVHSNLFGGGEIRGQINPSSSYSLGASLGGAQETPPNAGTGTGSCDLTIHADGSKLHVDLTVGGLTGTITAAHIHQGPFGSAGPVAFDLGAFVGRAVVNLVPSGDQISQLQQGQMYVNVHTTAFPGGEIRGQILPTDPTSVNSAFRGPTVLQLRGGPNPMTDETALRFSLPAPGVAHLDIFDLQGRVLRTLVSGPLRAGEGAVRWNGTTEGGREVQSGVYYARLTALGASQTVRLTVMR